MNRATIDRLAELARELDGKGEIDAAEAVREAVNELGPPAGLITTGEAAEKLGVAITTIRRWVQRRALSGVDTGTRLLISEESVDRLLRIRENLAEMDEEGSPDDDEIYEQVRRVRRRMNTERLGEPGTLAAG